MEDGKERLKVCFVGHDAAPSQCFKKVAIALDSDIAVTLIVGDGAYPECSDDDLRTAVQEADFVLLGMSSQAQFAEIEIKAGQFAREAGVPYGFYSDTSFAINRAQPGFWFHDLAHDVSLVVGLMHKGVVTIFPKAHFVATGNPIDEEMSFPPFERGVTRSKLNIDDADVLVQVSGGKFAASNCMTLLIVAEALAQQYDGQNWRLVFTPHPGDPALQSSVEADGVPSLYAEMAAYGPVPTQIILKQEMTSLEVLAGADVLVEFTGSISRAAAYQRIPVVSLQTESMNLFYQCEGGVLPLELVTAGAAVPVKFDVQVLANDLRMLVMPGTPIRERILAEQREKYPLRTEKGAAVQKLCRALMHMIT